MVIRAAQLVLGAEQNVAVRELVYVFLKCSHRSVATHVVNRMAERANLVRIPVGQLAQTDMKNVPTTEIAKIVAALVATIYVFKEFNLPGGDDSDALVSALALLIPS